MIEWGLMDIASILVIVWFIGLTYYKRYKDTGYLYVNYIYVLSFHLSYPSCHVQHLFFSEAEHLSISSTDNDMIQQFYPQ